MLAPRCHQVCDNSLKALEPECFPALEKERDENSSSVSDEQNKQIVMRRKLSRGKIEQVASDAS